jgi:hypothetical protein
MVPFASFGGGANQIGINSAGLASCESGYPTDTNGCTLEPYGACTKVSPLCGLYILYRLASWRQLMVARSVPYTSASMMITCYRALLSRNVHEG